MTTTAVPAAIAALQPAPVWQFFAGLAAVPRPSKSEQKAREHMKRLAAEHNFKLREDAVGNLVIAVPASPGLEKAPITVLQGHLDMVCEKNSGTRHDFEHDPIRLVLDQEPGQNEPIVRADGTTLGADNGIGVAMAFAAATSPDVRHGPLEILCTIDEEMGMTGAKALQPGFFKGRRMLNLDSEDDTVIYIGCAGGGDITLTWDFQRRPTPADYEVARLTVSGLRGGHSGGDIHENRGNAIKTLVRALSYAGLEGLRIVALSGGSKRNAIPREAEAVIAFPAAVRPMLLSAAGEVTKAVAQESAEAAAAIKVDEIDRKVAAHALSREDTQRLLRALTALPTGVLEMHTKVGGLVQTSNNLATVTPEELDGGQRLRVVVGCLSRSSMEGRVPATWAQIAAVGQLAGATVETGNSYPGWNPNPDSALLATARRVYEGLFNSSPNVTAIHAGLECGIIGERMGGGLDMISMGPTIRGAHSPDERVFVDSVAKSYRYLTALLGELAKG